MTELALEPGLVDNAANRLAARRARNGSSRLHEAEPDDEPEEPPEGDSGPAPAAASPDASSGPQGASGRPPCAYCGEPMPAGADPRARYCSQTHRRAAKRVRELAADGRPVDKPPGTVVEPAAPSAPPADDEVVTLVLQLVAHGADVAIERGGWRLVVSPRQ